MRIHLQASVSVGQKNPLRPVIWVSNPLEGYWLPQQCAVWAHTGRPRWAPKPGPVKPGGRVMESPQRGAVDPGSHPRTAMEAAHSGACSHRNKIQMYTTVCLDMHARVLLTKSTGMCQQRVNAGWDISRLSLVRFSRGIWIFPLLQEYSLKSPKPCQPTTSTPRGHWALTLRGINEKATSRVPEEIPAVLHQITAPRDGKKRRLSQGTLHYLKTICCLKSSLLTYLK